jgi:hypothetical protein
MSFTSGGPVLSFTQRAREPFSLGEKVPEGRMRGPFAKESPPLTSSAE